MAREQEPCGGHSPLQLKLWVSRTVGEGGEQPRAGHESHPTVAGKRKVGVSIQDRSKMGNFKILNET